MKKILIALIIVNVSTIPALASDWRGTDGHYIDVQSIMKYESDISNNRGNEYTYWSKKGEDSNAMAFYRKETKNKNVSEVWVKHLTDCDKQKTAIMSIVEYDKNQIPLSRFSYTDSQLNWNDIIPNTVDEYEYKLVCQQNKQYITGNYSNTTKTGNFSAVQIYENAVKSAVYIETKDKTGTSLKSGSGVIVLEDGTIVTCFHVIANADVIEVKLNDGSTYEVNGFRYINPLEDIAILTLDATRKFTPIKFNNSDNIKIGEKVYALANPQGLQFTFADGMINQKKEGILQFSAPASQGSSGGALLNEKGELIGIISSQYDPAESQNINFAIPYKYCLLKLQNYPVINTNNLGWTDFIVSKADSEQLKIYAGVAAYSDNYELLYKSLKLFAQRPDFPKDRYAMMGLMALASLLNSSDTLQYGKEAIEWFNKSLDAGYNVETSAYVLVALSPIYLEDREYVMTLIKKGMQVLNNKKYKDAKDKIENILNEISSCKKDENCLYAALKNILLGILELYDKEMGEKSENIDWFLNLGK